MVKIKQVVLLFVFIFGNLSYQVFALDCPYGLVDDAYPGECGRYVDENNDGLCDLSQDLSVGESELNDDVLQEDHEDEYSVEISGSDMKILTISEIASLWKIDAQELLQEIKLTFDLQESYTIENTIEDLRAENKFAPSQVKEIAENIKNQSGGISVEEDRQLSSTQLVKNKNPYNFPVPFFATVSIYVILRLIAKSDIGKKHKILSERTSKLFWNLVLVVTLIPSMFFGIALIGAYQFPFLAQMRKFLLYWHVEGSIVFGTVCILHLLERWRLFLAPIKSLGPFRFQKT